MRKRWFSTRDAKAVVERVTTGLGNLTDRIEELESNEQRRVRKIRRAIGYGLVVAAITIPLAWYFRTHTNEITSTPQAQAELKEALHEREELQAYRYEGGRPDADYYRLYHRSLRHNEQTERLEAWARNAVGAPEDLVNQCVWLDRDTDSRILRLFSNEIYVRLNKTSERNRAHQSQHSADTIMGMLRTAQDDFGQDSDLHRGAINLLYQEYISRLRARLMGTDATRVREVFEGLGYTSRP